jgi:thiol-disulfide isomerase/thioredoxin
MRSLVAAALLVVATALPHVVHAEKMKSFKLRTLNGGAEQSLASVLGKATLVVFFFPTCPYCNAAFPQVQRIYDAYKDQGLSMVWINVVPDEERLIPGWRAEHNYTVPILLGGRWTADDYKLRTTPTHYLLDARGEIIARKAGFNPGDEKPLEQEIQKALAR